MESFFVSANSFLSAATARSSGVAQRPSPAGTMDIARKIKVRIVNLSARHTTDEYAISHFTRAPSPEAPIFL